MALARRYLGEESGRVADARVRDRIAQLEMDQACLDLTLARARDGDVFVLNGQKVWTSFADKADWMFILVRTDVEAPKHSGITFLLMDMETPGVTVRPIKLISGSSPFCETFLADVRVPVRNVVGRMNGGWLLAKALLGHERTMIADAFKERDDAKRLVALARRYLGEESGRVAWWRSRAATSARRADASPMRASATASRSSRWTRPASI